MTNPSSPKSQQTISLTNQEVIDNLFFVYSLTKQAPEKIVFNTKLNFCDFKNLVVNLTKNKFISVYPVNTSGATKPINISSDTLEKNLNEVSDIGYLAFVSHHGCPFMYTQKFARDNYTLLIPASSNTKNETNNLIDLWYSLGNVKK